MPVPNVINAIRGWTKKTQVYIITKTVVNSVIQQTAIIYTMDMLLQPFRAQEVMRKPEEQRSWKWFSIITKASNPELEIDSEIVVDGISYRINSIQAWIDGGFRYYEAVQGFSGNDPMYTVTYDGNGADGGTTPQQIAYQSNAQPTVSANTFTKTGSTFNGWNTAADGSGTSYTVGSTLTIGTSNITLYAQWV